MDKQVIENYLDMVKDLQIMEYDLENEKITESEYVKALIEVRAYYAENNITREMLDEYNQQKRQAVKANTKDEAMKALNNFFAK